MALFQKTFPFQNLFFVFKKRFPFGNLFLRRLSLSALFRTPCAAPWFLIIRRFNVFQYHISRPLSHLTTRQLHGSHGCLKHSLMNQPVIIFSAINNILHIYRIILYLIKNQIPFFNKHLILYYSRLCRVKWLKAT